MSVVHSWSDKPSFVGVGDKVVIVGFTLVGVVNIGEVEITFASSLTLVESRRSSRLLELLLGHDAVDDVLVVVSELDAALPHALSGLAVVKGVVLIMAGRIRRLPFFAGVAAAPLLPKGGKAAAVAVVETDGAEAVLLATELAPKGGKALVSVMTIGSGVIRLGVGRLIGVTVAAALVVAAAEGSSTAGNESRIP